MGIPSILQADNISIRLINSIYNIRTIETRLFPAIASIVSGYFHGSFKNHQQLATDFAAGNESIEDVNIFRQWYDNRILLLLIIGH